MATQIFFFSSRTLGESDPEFEEHIFQNGVGSTFLRHCLKPLPSGGMPRRRQDSSRSKRLGNGKSKCTVITSIEGCWLNEHWWYPVISWKVHVAHTSVSRQLVLIMTKIWHQNYATTLFPVPRTRQKSSTWQKTWHGTSEGNSWNMGWKMATSIAVTFLKLVSGPFFPMRLGELLGR